MQPEPILRYWQAIEYLLPHAAPKCKPKFCWEIRGQDDLPWLNGQRVKHLRADETWVFHVYVGLLDMKRLAERVVALLQLGEADYENDRFSEPAAMLAFVVDRGGFVLDGPVISSVPWAMACIRRFSRGGPLAFDGFEGEQGYRDTTQGKLGEFLADLQSAHACEAERNTNPHNPDEQDSTKQPRQQRATTLQDIQAMLSLALDLCECRDDLVLCGEVRVQAVRVSKKRDPESPILNSPFGPELAHLRQLWKQGRVGYALERYVLGIDPREYIDVVHSDEGREVLRHTLPACMPVGRWPARFPMALAQQFAVNTIKRDLLAQPEGLFSVNGPPGTGKTTLLRDVIAMLVVERARHMAELPKAAQAFKRTDGGIRGDRPGHMFTLQPENICGYGMTVACFSNKAAQNVTRELPAAKSIDAENVIVDYFTDVAETVLAHEEARSRSPGSAWGLVAAVLGKAELRNHFINRFWFAQSHEQEPGAATSQEGPPFVSFQSVLAAGVPGATPWDTQRKRFLEALRNAEAALNQRQKLAEALCDLDTLQAQVGELQARDRDADAALATRRLELSQAAQKHDEACQRRTRAQALWESARELARAEEELASHMSQVPPLCGVVAPSRWTSGAADACVRELRGLVEVEQRALANLVLRRPGWLARCFGTHVFLT